MKKLDELDLPALRALAKRTYLHQMGAKTPKSRHEAAEERRKVLSVMRVRVGGDPIFAATTS